MVTVDVTLKLPEELVVQAQNAGILTGERVAELLQTELERQQRIQRYFNTLEQLASVEPRLTPDEIEAEIIAYRREKRKNKADASE